jgi:hypothetical protein
MHVIKLTVALLAAGAAASLLGVTAATAAAPAPCAPDVQKFCSTAPAGAGQVLTCLEEHRDEITPECKAALATVRRHAPQRHGGRPMPAWIKPCAGDINTLCKNEARGEKQAAECLAQHRSALSSGCKAAFEHAAQ